MSFADLKGLGPARRKALAEAGIDSCQKLLMYFPIKYIDYTKTSRIADCVPGEEAVFEVSVSGRPTQARVNGRTITRAVLCDESGKIAAAWFNQSWMFKTLAEAERLTVYGRIEEKNGRRSLTCPRIVTERCLMPVYKSIESVPPKFLRQLMLAALEDVKTVAETLPEVYLERYDLMPKTEALTEIHFPTCKETLERALKRFSFEDMLYFMVNAVTQREYNREGVSIPCKKSILDEYLSRLSFPLTGAQSRVLNEILSDMLSSAPMARLVQGDVGSGKTAVAFGAIYAAAKAGYQSAMMAPTEILAAQHYETALKQLPNISCGLLTGSMTAKQHKAAAEKIRSGEWQAVFGTHALISRDIEYSNLGLVITDEQHRFGVRQRTRLSEKGEGVNVLVMSATPIPRTLALILFGDLDISVIDELPPGRKPVKTRLVPGDKRDAMYDFISKEIDAGRQAYFVCPLVEDSEITQAESAEALFEALGMSKLSRYGIGLVHGKMNEKEKNDVLTAFKNAETKVLVSTTVIEVGINVPNATVMVVENAERFGLAQLHQLRGRVGRGTDEAWCFLMANGTQKLKVLTQTNDGFEIAQKDMELRGPGDMFGTRQTGSITGLDVRAAEDARMLKLTHDIARQAHKSDSDEARILKENAAAWLNDKTEVIFAAN